MLFSHLLFSQKVNVERAYYRNRDEKKINIEISLNIENLELDSINRIELKNNAIIHFDKETKSDDFYTDKYFDNFNNRYRIVFQTSNKNLKTIKYVKGTFKYFTPSLTKQSIVNLNITENSYGKLIFNDSNSRIKILAIKVDSTFNKETKFKKYLKEVFKQNHLKNNKTAVKSFIKYRYSSVIPKNLKSTIFFYAENPTDKVVSLNSIFSPTVTAEFHSEKQTIWELRYFNETVPAELPINVILENKQSLREFKFKIENIKIE
jgi:hypothetical protein